MVDVRLENLSFSYPDGRKALSNINLEIPSGQFVVLCGKSGSGKTTLLRMLKKELSPFGKTEGKIELFGKDKNALSLRKSAQRVGFMLQSSEFQIVTHTVRSEIAFGLENLGLSRDEIRLRLAEISSYFSLSDIMDKKNSELSGGQKQLVCLAAICAMHPDLLILDEPTSQLDPMTAELLINTVFKLCKENAITVIISEHRLESLIPKADRVIVMENSEIICDEEPSKIAGKLLEKSDFLKASVPTSVKLHASLNLGGKAPLTVSQGRQMLCNLFESNPPRVTALPLSEKKANATCAVKMRDVFFAYDKSGYVLHSFNLTVPQGSFFAVMGENAAGKTTAVKLMCGLLECKRGKIELFSKSIKKYSSYELYHETVACLPQKCETLFAGPTVKEDFESLLKDKKLSKAQRDEEIRRVSEFFEISHLLDAHPYDISGGELQRAALAMTMLRKPKLLVLDEPTKGMDNLFKERFAQKMKELSKSGITVIIVSHDTEFCAKHCDECALIFDGVCTTQTDTHSFFSENFFYTTAASKISRRIFKKAITESEVLALCRENLKG